MLGIVQRVGAVGAIDAAVTETPPAAVLQRGAVQAGLRVVVITVLRVHIQVIYKRDRENRRSWRPIKCSHILAFG